VHQPFRRALAVLLALAAALVVVPASGALAAPPAQDPFYTPPSPLPAGQPGDVIRSRSARFTLDPILKIPAVGVRSWQVLYRTTNANGQPIAVSGTVLVPTAPWRGSGQRPVVTYGVGTRGLGDSCAPSYTLSQGTDYEGAFIASALAKNWAVVISDMRGLGTPGAHTYEVGREQGTAVLDMVRAARRTPGTGLSATGPVGVMGYSQGGTSAGWAAELASTYAPELDIKGVSAGGVPADLDAVADGLDGGLFVAFALFAAVGYDEAYPELNLEGYLNDRGRRTLQQFGDVCLASVDGIKGIFTTAFTDIDDYVTTNPLDTPQWQARLAENRLGARKPPMPVFQYHGLIDEIVPFGQAATLRRDWCARGTNLTWKVYPLAEHALGLAVGAGPAVDFLADRFAGKAVSGTC
jgi:hypothetical protein